MKSRVVFICLVTMMLTMLLMSSCLKKAQAEVIISSPMETSIVGFWFMQDGTFAPGVAHTVGRANWSVIPKVNFDIDVCVAKKVNNSDNDVMGGLGFKLGYRATEASKPGWTFDPSIGVAILNNFSKYKTFIDIATHYEPCVYGSAVLYKWY